LQRAVQGAGRVRSQVVRSPALITLVIKFCSGKSARIPKAMIALNARPQSS